MKREKRGHWYLLTGLVLGAVLGLLYAWWINPREKPTAPAVLNVYFKDQYRTLIAVAYLSNGDLVRAKARLDLLRDANPAEILALQAQGALAQGRPDTEVRALDLLAAALREDANPAAPPLPLSTDTPGAVLLPTLTPTALLVITSTVTSTPKASSTPAAISQVQDAVTVTQRPATRTPAPSATYTALPTRTSTATPGAAFAMTDQQLVCDPTMGGPLMLVEVRDAAGNPVPGVEIIVNWDGSEDRFFTGLKPEFGIGFADYLMTPGVNYTLHLAKGSQLIQGITSTECEASAGIRIWGNWQLVFEQPVE